MLHISNLVLRVLIIKQVLRLQLFSLEGIILFRQNGRFFLWIIQLEMQVFRKTACSILERGPLSVKRLILKWFSILTILRNHMTLIFPQYLVKMNKTKVLLNFYKYPVWDNTELLKITADIITEYWLVIQNWILYLWVLNLTSILHCIYC